jgi:hypothetical protein
MQLSSKRPIFRSNEQIRHDSTQINNKVDPKKKPFWTIKIPVTTLKISKRAAQTWRDESKISFSQGGNKIYYKLSDVRKANARALQQIFQGKIDEKLCWNLQSLAIANFETKQN